MQGMRQGMIEVLGELAARAVSAGRHEQAAWLIAAMNALLVG